MNITRESYVLSLDLVVKNKKRREEENGKERDEKKIR